MTKSYDDDTVLGVGAYMMAMIIEVSSKEQLERFEELLREAPPNCVKFYTDVKKDLSRHVNLFHQWAKENAQ